MSSYFVAQAGLELAVFLLRAPKCQDYKSGPLYTAQIQFLIFFSLCICCMLVAIHLWGAEFGIRLSYSFLSYTPYLPFGTGSFTKPRVSHFTRVAGQLAPEICLPHPFSVWVTVTYASFCLGAGPSTCTSRCREPSPQPQFLNFNINTKNRRGTCQAR